MAMMSKTQRGIRPTVIPCPADQLNSLLTTEWLRTNSMGAYASSSVIGCNSRRYHGLLVASLKPPLGRIVALSTIMEQLVIGKKIYDLATNEFVNTFSPEGYLLQVEFRDDTTATFVYEVEGVRLTKRVLLSNSANAVLVRYELSDKNAKLLLRPFTPMRDFHALRSYSDRTEFVSEPTETGVIVKNCSEDIPPLYLTSEQAAFHSDPQWWYRVQYRIDLSRGQDGYEDLYSPGLFVWKPGKKKSCKISASIGQAIDVKYKPVLEARRNTQAEYTKILSNAPRPIRRLAAACEPFLVDRWSRNGMRGLSILAGFPWFGDWGRDTFIALPGLLLTTGQFELARRVFLTYADAISEGMIPNRFDDYGREPHYNSIDASLWFIIAAERYLRAVEQADPAEVNIDDAQRFWRKVLLPACQTILTNYADGTRFGIHADADGLLTGGSYDTQLTWMDAKLGQDVITARFGKAVEINALWHSAHAILAERLKNINKRMATDYAVKTARIAAAFEPVFWNEQFDWLNDVVNDTGADASLRPNQIFAVSLPYSPLSPQRQRRVVEVVQETLLTPVGLRSLAPADPRYRRRYGGSWESRERAYHQGTVWAWLIGPFIEAYLNVETAAGRNKNAIAQAKAWLAGFDEHLDVSGLGSVSEIFDGDAPHAPHGCFAQAWSVGEVLRAKCLVQQHEKA